MDKFKETLNNFIEMAEKDVEIHIDDLEEAMFKSIAVKQKWINTLHKFKTILTKKKIDLDEYFEEEKKKLTEDNYVAYTEKDASNKVKLSGTYIAMTIDLSHYERIVSFITDTISNLTDRNYMIRNIIEYKKFMGSID